MKNSTPNVKTRFLVISDTHGIDLSPELIRPADVVIHCGDLTLQSKLDEFRTAIRLLEKIDAPLKLVIAGNHEFTMDIPVFQKKIAEAPSSLDPTLIQKVYGDFGEARSLFHNTSISLLDEGTHNFTLQNGASLTVFASPYVPSSLGGWGFQYHPDQGHEFAIPNNVDVVITHGPPKGIMDYANSGRAGCSSLFGAVAQARPRMHCFGHIHESWGANFVSWRERISEKPSYLTDIDNGGSVVIKKLSDLARDSKGYHQTSHCTGDPNPLQPGSQTLFVNAAIEGTEDYPVQPPWLIDIELPRAV